MESACDAGDLSSIPGLRRPPGEGNDSPLQYSCLENSMDRGAWWATVTNSPHSLDCEIAQPIKANHTVFLGLLCGSDGKESSHNAGDLGLIPGLGRSCGEGNGNPLHYSGLENSMDRGAWRATVPGMAKSQTRLND